MRGLHFRGRKKLFRWRGGLGYFFFVADVDSLHLTGIQRAGSLSAQLGTFIPGSLGTS